jgi:Ca2+-dependent lipid-binding protein
MKEMTWKELTDWEGLVKHNVDIYDDKGKVSGSMKFTTTFNWIEYKPPKPSDLLDKKTMMRIVIKSATFLKDSDLIGKQDPYIKFKYEGKDLKTDVKDDAGLNASWDEVF